MMGKAALLCLCLLIEFYGSAGLRPASQASRLFSSAETSVQPAQHLNLPNPTSAGYIAVENASGSAMYFMYFEADPEEEDDKPDLKTAPILVWLQVSKCCKATVPCDLYLTRFCLGCHLAGC